jgi:hypothetical protein
MLGQTGLLNRGGRHVPLPLKALLLINYKHTFGICL